MIRPGIWMFAGTPVTAPYPCFCRPNRECKTWGHPSYMCPCWGRTDLDGLPSRCCAPAFRPRQPIPIEVSV